MAPKRRERWYSLDGQRRIHQSALQSNTGPRRLISLVVLLLLVMMMIQQVSDSKKVAKVAGAVGLLPVDALKSTETDNSTPSAEDPSDTDLQVEYLGLSAIDPTVDLGSQVFEQLMRNLLPNAKAKLVEQLFGIIDRSKTTTTSDPNSTDSIDSWLEASKATLSRWVDLTDIQSPEHGNLEALRVALENSTTAISKGDLDQVPEQLLRSLRLALDRTLLSDLSDNTPWRTTERLSLARLLDRGSQLGKYFDESILIDAVPSIAIPQLLSQTETLRGRCYRVQGTVGLIDQPSSIELENSRKLSYSVIWLRPDDLSDQPINIYIPDSVKPNGQLKQGDTVQVAGLIAKKRAYASKRGGEIAPVLIATSVVLGDATSPPEERLYRSLAVAKGLSASRNRLVWTPPVDRQAPLDLVQQAISKYLGEFPAIDATIPAPQALVEDPKVLASLSNLVKFQNEVDTVVAGGNSAMLGKVPGAYEPILSSWPGYVVSWIACKVDPQLLPGLDWPEVYALKVEIAGDANSLKPSTVLVKDIPVLWKKQPQIRQPVLISGLGLAPISERTPSHDSTSRNLPSIVLASRVAWQMALDNTKTPISIAELNPNLSHGHSQLLESGWDLSQLDTLESMHGQSISNKEARAFYTLIARSDSSQGKNNPSQNSAVLSESMNVMQWIRGTEAMKTAKKDDGSLKRTVGEKVRARVQVRRIQRVDVRSPLHQSWLGSNHYYQLDGVADIGPSRIEVKYGKDFEPISYEREFPITLVAAGLPSWILADPTTLGAQGQSLEATTDLDTSSTIAWSTKIRVDVMGYAYRVWRFRTPQVSAATQDTGYQQAPMMVVDHWELSQGPSLDDEKKQQSKLSMGSIVTTIIGLAAICWFAFRMMPKPLRKTDANQRSGFQNR
ncbi:MAG: hypothetical protein ACK6DQ_14545 [Planctomycetota bacterium]